MSPSATPATPNKVDVAKRHACHAKRRWMSPSATPATPNEGGCRQVSHLPRKVPRRDGRLTAAKRATRASPVPQVSRLPRKTKVDVAKCQRLLCVESSVCTSLPVKTSLCKTPSISCHSDCHSGANPVANLLPGQKPSIYGLWHVTCQLSFLPSFLPFLPSFHPSIHPSRLPRKVPQRHGRLMAPNRATRASPVPQVPQVPQAPRLPRERKWLPRKT